MTNKSTALNRRGRTVAVVQARMGSSRLPEKTMTDLAGRPAIAWTLGRVAAARRLDALVLATPSDAGQSPLWAAAGGLDFPIFKGDENDVMTRVLEAARQQGAQVVVRITADCPLIDPSVIDKVVAAFHESKADYVSNTLERSFPDGLDVEVFSRDALIRADAEVSDPFLRAHVTPYIHGRLRDRLPAGEFTREQVVQSQDFSMLRWTLDEPDDVAFLQRLAPRLKEGFGWLDVVAELMRDPALMRINRGHVVYEGTERDLAARSGSGLGHVPEADGEGANDPTRRYRRSMALFERASRHIPLATQTFSKSHMQWVKGAAPLFLEHGRGARVWDVDGSEYIDYVLGLLPNVLGYCDPDVDVAIDAQLSRGISFSLATELESELAELLNRLIPSAEMVRYGKNGSDATTGAIRLARAYTGREHVVMAGYHGWHDWYIGTTARDLGVPAAVKALSHRAPFGDLDALEAVFKKHPDGVAAFVLEADGATPPPSGYLEGVRMLCDRYGVLLVFDEIISGFRVDLGGAQRARGVTPDLSCFGKAMANGMPISALVGRADVMAKMNDIFFSGTFGGEALSLAAAIATIRKLEREDAPARMKALGIDLIDAFNKTSERHGLGDVVRMNGPDWWPRLTVGGGPTGDANLTASLLRQFFVEAGLLLGASLNLSLAHLQPAVRRDTLARADAAMSQLAESLARAPERRLRGERLQAVFSVR